ncbi:MAG: hypothetical protein WC717_05545 [Candidatus Micrarchaeia archaeon]|jgi:hypothetical protein
MQKQVKGNTDAAGGELPKKFTTVGIDAYRAIALAAKYGSGQSTAKDMAKAIRLVKSVARRLSPEALEEMPKGLEARKLAYELASQALEAAQTSTIMPERERVITNATVFTKRALAIESICCQ